MAKALIGGGECKGHTSVTGGCQHINAPAYLGVISTAESVIQWKSPVAGTVSFVGIHWDNVGTTRTCQFRKNGGNGNEVVTDSTGVNAWYYDAVNTDSVAINDLINYQRTFTGSTPTVFSVTAVFEATGSQLVSIMGPGTLEVSAIGTFYTPVCNNSFFGGNTTENNAKALMRGGNGTHTISYFQCCVTSANTATLTNVLNKNNTPLTSTLSITANTTGLFVDTTHTDTFVSGDTLDFSITTTNTTATAWSPSIVVTWAGAEYDLSGSSEGNRVASATTHFMPLTGINDGTVPQTVEANAQLAFKYTNAAGGRGLHNMRTFVLTNTYAATVSMKLRKNGTDATNVLSITNGVTGWFEDTTHNDLFTDNDLWSYSIVGGTSGNLDTGQSMITVDNGGAPVVPSILMPQIWM